VKGGFQKVSMDRDRRTGIVTHPFLLTAFAYHNNTSPIHRGVFLTRNLVGMTLKSPPMANDMTRIATLQFMRSVGQARMHWLGIGEGHHGLSHEPDKNKEAVDKLIRINEWFAGELAYLAKKLAGTPEPGADGSMLDHTLIVWVNELGEGNRHILTDIPFVLIGGKAHGFRMGRSLKLQEVAHNRLWLAVAQAMGHELKTFGTEKYCEGGAIRLS
jgi:hypothetical protein